MRRWDEMQIAICSAAYEVSWEQTFDGRAYQLKARLLQNTSMITGVHCATAGCDVLALVHMHTPGRSMLEAASARFRTISPSTAAFDLCIGIDRTSCSGWRSDAVGVVRSPRLTAS